MGEPGSRKPSDAKAREDKGGRQLQLADNSFSAKALQSRALFSTLERQLHAMVSRINSQYATLDFEGPVQYFAADARAMPGCITMSCKYASTRSTSACTARARRAAHARARHRDAYRRRQGRRAIAWRRDRRESGELHNGRRHKLVHTIKNVVYKTL